MTSAELERRSPETPNPKHDIDKDRTSVVRRMSGTMKIIRTGAAMLRGRLPGTVRATRTGAHGATTALQRLPDSTLRWLTASSLGLAAGLHLAGAPRLVRAAGVAPALIMEAAIALRPSKPVVPTDADR